MFKKNPSLDKISRAGDVTMITQNGIANCSMSGMSPHMQGVAPEQGAPLITCGSWDKV